jgi:hypothetical protein
MRVRDLIAEEMRQSRHLYEMANIGAEDTGLPYSIYVSHKGNSRHGPRAKVYPFGSKDQENVVIVSVAKDPKVLRLPDRKVPAWKVAAVVEFVRSNAKLLRKFWDDGDMTIGALMRSLKRADE